jgi:hypothetical protein
LKSPQIPGLRCLNDAPGAALGTSPSGTEGMIVSVADRPGRTAL